MKGQRSQRKNDITKQMFADHKSTTANDVNKQNNELRNAYFTTRLVNDTTNNKTTETSTKKNTKKTKQVITIEKKPNSNNNVISQESTVVERKFDHRVHLEKLTFQSTANSTSGINKMNFDKLNPAEIALHDYLWTLVKRNIYQVIKDIDHDTWNQKTIVFEIPENGMLSAMRYETNNQKLDINFYDVFEKKTNKGKKLIACNLFRTLNNFDTKNNTRNSYNNYIISGCSIVADKYNNIMWRVMLFVEHN